MNTFDSHVQTELKRLIREKIIIHEDKVLQRIKDFKAVVKGAKMKDVICYVFRGDSWYFDPNVGCRSARRGIGHPNIQNDDGGFRVVCVPRI